MRIAFVTETWLPSTDGVVTRISATVRELRRAGHDVLIIAPEGGEPDFAGAVVRGVPTIAFRWIYGGKHWGLPVARIRRYLREFDPDVVHVVNPLLMGIAAVRAAHRANWPLVASYHTNVARYAGYYHLGWLRPVIWWMLRKLHDRAAINLATTAATCAELRERGIDRVELWRRGVDIDQFRPDPVRPSEGRRPVALYVGRLAEEKGIHRLAALADPASGVDLRLVGDGPAMAELRERFAAPTVTFTGMLHGADLAAAYADADVFVFPSTTDTLGLVLLEALASNLPVLAADSPASREILRDCPAGQLFTDEQTDQLPRLVQQTCAIARTGQFGTAARQEAERWSWAAATEELLNRYRALLAQRQPPQPRGELPANTSQRPARVD